MKTYIDNLPQSLQRIAIDSMLESIPICCDFAFEIAKTLTVVFPEFQGPALVRTGFFNGESLEFSIKIYQN